MLKRAIATERQRDKEQREVNIVKESYCDGKTKNRER